MIKKYKKQAELLLSVLEISLKDNRFALKGGTAINLFYRDLPRYSVDIDLCYLPLEDRTTSMENIHLILHKISAEIRKLPRLRVTPSQPLNGRGEAKLQVEDHKVKIKIEPNYILRGHLFPTRSLPISKKAVDEFGVDFYANCLSFEDVYGGKICAALDRQHPRDLFDIKVLFENEGLTENIKHAFLLYLISGNRPFNEMLMPNHKDISGIYEADFKDMANIQVTLEELVQARSMLCAEILKSLNNDDRAFLQSFVRNTPDWHLVKHSKIKDFPAVRWKLLNQQKMSKEKRIGYINAIDELLQASRNF